MTPVVDGNAERMDACVLGFQQRLASILDTVFAALAVVVIRFAVRQGDQQTGTCFYRIEQTG